MVHSYYCSAAFCRSFARLARLSFQAHAERWHARADATTTMTCIKIRARLRGKHLSSVVPRLFATPDAFGNLCLKGWRTEREPVLTDLIDKAPAVFGAELHQPIQGFLLWSLASRNNHVDRQTLPDEVCRQHDHVRPVRPHPIR